MTIPFEIILNDQIINLHGFLEILAFFFAFRYYIFLRRNQTDYISSKNRHFIILGAVIGALLGSRLMGFLEDPVPIHNYQVLLESKTIMGGLFGGLICVEITKWKIGEKKSSGDLFTLPIILGIFIGRIGCFLTGVNEFTYGSETTFFLGMNLGDGLQRHPIALYEMIYLAIIYFIIRRLGNLNKLDYGDLFKLFMILYFSFRFMLEFIKPNVFLIFGFSSIQYLCLLCLLYYYKTITKFIKYAS